MESACRSHLPPSHDDLYRPQKRIELKQRKRDLSLLRHLLYGSPVVASSGSWALFLSSFWRWLHLSSQRSRPSTLPPESTPPSPCRHLPSRLMRLPSEVRMSWSRRPAALRTKPPLPLTLTTRVTSS